MAANPKYNSRNPAVKRIMQEMKEMREHKSTEFIAEALENDIFEWHFVIKGPAETEFEGGIYHGRILLPPEYPFKPPAFMMLTPSGRFETGVKICLSISSHHPEHWQPSWSIRTALTALIAFMPSPGQGALGSLDFSKEERRAMVPKSRAEPPRFGSADRQKVIDEMHKRMLALQEECAAAAASGGAGADAGSGEQAQGEALPSAGASLASAPSTEGALAEAATTTQAAATSGASRQGSSTAPPASPAAASTSLPSTPSKDTTGAVVAPKPQASTSGGPAAAASPALVTATQSSAPAYSAASTPASASATQQQLQQQRQQQQAHGMTLNGGGRQHAAAAPVTTTDHMLTAIMWALYVGIGAILLRKAMVAFGVDINDLLQ